VSRNYTPPSGFGVSWGGRGFRIGRSQYGTWWFSVGLPFGFRFTKRVGRLRDVRGTDERVYPQPIDTSPPLPPEANPTTETLSDNLTENEKILEKIRLR
jgi:hypothetical protein